MKKLSNFLIKNNKYNFTKMFYIQSYTNFCNSINNRKEDLINYSYNTNNFLSKTINYEQQLKDVINDYVLIDEPVEGFATKEGTKFYSNRNKETVHKDHFKKTYDLNNNNNNNNNENAVNINELTISSIGLGSYIGPPDDINDFYLYNSVKSSVLSGSVNHIDTAINYRYMKSEKAIGKAIQMLIHKYKFKRQELIISSKVGFIPEDAETGKRCHSFVQELIENNLLSFEDIIFDELKRPIHCIHKEYIKSQIDLSLKNLNLKTLDVYYLHNVFETQSVIPDEKLLLERLSKAFETLEELRLLNKIRYYGLATWNSFRVQDSNKQYCSLQNIVELAEKIGGKDNGFKFVQCPINIVNPEAFIENYQNFTLIEDADYANKSSKDDRKSLKDIMNDPIKGDEGNNNINNNSSSHKIINTTLTALCNHYKINLISSSPLMQGVLVNLPLENSVLKVRHNASKHIQLIRSIPADCIKSTLIGMKNQVNIKNNLEVSRVSPLSASEFYEVLSPKKRAPYIEKEVL